MKRSLAFLLTLVVCATLDWAHAAEETLGNNVTRYFGSASADNGVLFTSGDLVRYDACMLMATTGTVDVYATLDGTNYSTTPVSLQDHGSVTVDPVNEAAALRVYSIVGKYRGVRVLQKGATAAAASLLCWDF